MADEHVIFNSYMPTIWRYLTEVYTEEGAAGLMGNLYAESHCTPYACQPKLPKSTCLSYIEKVDNGIITKDQFVHGGCSETGGYTSTQLGFGLAQWTWWSRKQGLYNKIFPHGELSGHTLNDIYAQTEYVIDEISEVIDFEPVYNTLTTSHDINACSDICLEIYEDPEDQSQAVHELRRRYSKEIYDKYATHPPVEYYTIAKDVQGDGTVTVPSMAQAGDDVELKCIPSSGQTLNDINIITESGESVAISVVEIQTFIMPAANILVHVLFSGETPPTPPTPTSQMLRHRMPVWMYPFIRNRRN